MGCTTGSSSPDLLDMVKKFHADAVRGAGDKHEVIQPNKLPALKTPAENLLKNPHSIQNRPKRPSPQP